MQNENDKAVRRNLAFGLPILMTIRTGLQCNYFMKMYEARTELIHSDRHTVTKLTGDLCSFIPPLSPESASKTYRVAVVSSRKMPCSSQTLYNCDEM
jgi:hypothetical protein